MAAARPLPTYHVTQSIRPICAPIARPTTRSFIRRAGRRRTTGGNRSAALPSEIERIAISGNKWRDVIRVREEHSSSPTPHEETRGSLNVETFESNRHLAREIGPPRHLAARSASGLGFDVAVSLARVESATGERGEKGPVT